MKRVPFEVQTKGEAGLESLSVWEAMNGRAEAYSMNAVEIDDDRYSLSIIPTPLRVIRGDQAFCCVCSARAFSVGLLTETSRFNCH